jgi:ubiquinone/menaquinone biosynthesis C-methylase UbiE
MSDSDTGYRVGSAFGDEEIARLELQGRVLAPFTRMIWAGVGIRSGMRVLDLGCGPGDSTFVAADLVGPGGSVVGVDHSPDALARARYRAAQRGLAQVQFIEGDIHDPAPGGPYDAIVERLTLWLVPDPAEVLRRQATVLRPGGLIIVNEGVQSTAQSVPESALWTQLMSWQVEAFARAGMEHIGPRLWAIVEEAGLRRLGMMEGKTYFVPGDEDGLAWICGDLPQRLPAALRGHRSGHRRRDRCGDARAAAEGRMGKDWNGNQYWLRCVRVGDHRPGVTPASSGLHS